MSKFEVELEITGFKFRVKGERDDVPALVDNLRQQVTGLLPQLGKIADDRVAAKFVESSTEPEIVNLVKPRRTVAAKSRRSGLVSQSAKSTVAWSHDPDKWGNPRQQWTTPKKLLWLLYVATSETGVSELSGPAIADAFNTKFRETGLLQKRNMPRDLGGLKLKTLVGSDNDRSPIAWFLTEEGRKEAVKLVTEAKGSAKVE